MLFQDEIYIEKWENYVRQSYRSRCLINAANGVLALSVPVEGGRSKKLIKDIRIVSGNSWIDQHLRSIMSAYGKAPFFEHYIGDIESFFQKRYTFLYDLSIESMTLCLKMMNLKIQWKETSTFIHDYNKGEKDFRNEFNAKNSEGYPDFFKPQEYFQLFGKQFAVNLSILDLIMCEGPQASSILRGSFIPGMNN
ncbi:MAG: hypothetical protein HKN68_19550 [Saprospiraceae bacterium]|nr:hypothetical protein [Saprospiraceae bacterium]